MMANEDDPRRMLGERIATLAERVGELTSAVRRNRGLLKLGAAGLVLDICLSVGLTYAIITAKADSCRAVNRSNVANQQLWTGLFELPVDHVLTQKEIDQRTAIEGVIKAKLATRPC